jgi:hypothetical protein
MTWQLQLERIVLNSLPTIDGSLDQGGLGIEVLETKNRCLLCKWLFKLMNEEGVWQEL